MGMFANGFSLSSVLALIMLFFIIKFIIGLFSTPKPVPRTSNQRQLVQDVIRTIEQKAPNFDKIEITTNSMRIIAGDNRFSYDFKEHYYEVSLVAAKILASEIVRHFGGELKSMLYIGDLVGYSVTSARLVNEEKERQRRYNERVRKC